MQNSIPKFRQRSIISEETRCLSEKLKIELQLPRVQYFLLKFCTRFLLNNVYKRVFGTILFCLDLELLKNVKKEYVETTSFLIFTNNSSKQNKENLEHAFVYIGK